jgi:rare lipoprotein A
MTIAVLVTTSAFAIEPPVKGGGHHKIGPTYAIKGKAYTPKAIEYMDETGVASWYGGEFHGRKTANGEMYDKLSLTAAHKTLPLPSYVYVTNLDNNRRLLVRVNDRGPFIGNRLIDVSQGVAQLLGFHRLGTAKVRIEYAGPAPLNGNDTAERHILAQQEWYATGPPPVFASVTSSTVLAMLNPPPAMGAEPVPDLPAVTVPEAPANAEPVRQASISTDAIVRMPPVVAPGPLAAAPSVAIAKAKASKPVRVAAQRRGADDDGTGYKPFDPCWSCIDSSQR